MTFFDLEGIDTLKGASVTDIEASETLQAYRAKLHRLSDLIAQQIRTQNLDLHQIDPAKPVTYRSGSSIDNKGAMCLQYLRTKTQAVTVERLMGREEVASVHNIDTRRHPMVEMRLIPTNFVVEMLISPDAWWDQENLAGKLTIPRHKQSFHSLLQNFKSSYCMGFWRGTHLSDLHLTAAQFQHPRIMQEWMSTFEPGKDWFRLGIWYEFDSETLSEDKIVEELVTQMRHLFAIYEHFLWTSDNNYRDFYEK